MRDVLTLRVKGADTGMVLSGLKGWLGARAFTVEAYDQSNSRLSARKTSTLLVALGLDRALDALVSKGDRSGSFRTELRWKGLLRGCTVSFIETFMLALIIGRDLGLRGFLISFLVGSIFATLNIGTYIVQRFLLKRALSADLKTILSGPTDR